MISRRNLFALLCGLGGTAAAKLISSAPAAATTVAPPVPRGKGWTPFEAMTEVLAGRIGPDSYRAWFRALKFEGYERGVLTLSVPVEFIRKWIVGHYDEELTEAARAAFGAVERVELLVRHVGLLAHRRRLVEKHT